MWRDVPFACQRRPIIGVLRMCWLLPGSFDCFCCPHTSVHRPSIACLAVFLCGPGALFLHALSGPSTICPFPPHGWSAPPHISVGHRAQQQRPTLQPSIARPRRPSAAVLPWRAPDGVHFGGPSYPFLCLAGGPNGGAYGPGLQDTAHAPHGALHSVFLWVKNTADWHRFCGFADGSVALIGLGFGVWGDGGVRPGAQLNCGLTPGNGAVMGKPQFSGGRLRCVRAGGGEGLIPKVQDGFRGAGAGPAKRRPVHSGKGTGLGDSPSAAQRSGGAPRACDSGGFGERTGGQAPHTPPSGRSAWYCPPAQAAPRLLLCVAAATPANWGRCRPMVTHRTSPPPPAGRRPAHPTQPQNS